MSAQMIFVFVPVSREDGNIKFRMLLVFKNLADMQAVDSVFVSSTGKRTENSLSGLCVLNFMFHRGKATSTVNHLIC